MIPHNEQNLTCLNQNQSLIDMTKNNQIETLGIRRQILKEKLEKNRICVNMKNEIDVMFDTDEKYTLWDMQELIEKNYKIHTTKDGIKIQIHGIIEFDLEDRTKIIRLQPAEVVEST